jgi:MFS family permease
VFNFLDKKHSVAKPGHSRWLIPPAALAIHLAIGQVYSLSVFNLPLTRIIGVTESTAADWQLTTVGWIFSIAIVFLGLSAALFGKWLEREGPRKAMFVAALCFSGGFFISALGVYLHNIWLVYLGYGVFGGIGLGIGYISPVSTLIKWFPDKPGMATGMAIMGFGGGAMIGSPLAVNLLNRFSSETSAGVWETMLVMGTIYFCLMMIAVFLVRVPPENWKPEGFSPAANAGKMITNNHVDADTALKTKQFWLLWVMLCVNVTAGIGVLGQASPMVQEMFAGSVTAQDAAVFVALLSFFNLAGRFIWSSFSDKIGRQTVYGIYFGLGLVLYSLIPSLGRLDTTFWFIAAFALIMTMYGGGFATLPAYLRDLFGTYQVGAIHGRVLTAWSTAGVLGPVLINYIRQAQVDAGIPAAEAYSLTMYIMASLLLIGFICNMAIKAVDEKHHVPETALSPSQATG